MATDWVLVGGIALGVLGVALLLVGLGLKLWAAGRSSSEPRQAEQNEFSFPEDDAGDEPADSDAEAESEPEPEPEPEPRAEWPSRSKQWLATIFNGFAIAVTAVGALFETFLPRSTKYPPASQRIWRWVLMWGYKGLKRSTGAPLIGHEMKKGRILHKPLQYNSERDRWETSDGEEWWNGRDDGADTFLGPGGTPCAWAASKATQLGTQVQAETAEALDLGLGQAVFTDAKVSVYNAAAQVSGDGQQRAMGDGGQVANVRMTVDHPGMLSDYVIPLDKMFVDTETDEVYDTRLLSVEKYYETYPEDVDSEEMKKQEDRGRLAEQDRDLSAYAMKMLLIAGAVIVLSLAVVFIVPKLLEGQGGSSGGVIPFAAGAWDLAKLAFGLGG